jgi:hypothetical protein
MKDKDQITLLQEKILLLEISQMESLSELKMHAQLAFDSVNPISFIRNTISDITTSPPIKNNIVNSLVGMATGYVGKAILIGKAHNPMSRILGTVLQFAISNFVSKHTGIPNTISRRSSII